MICLILLVVTKLLLGVKMNNYITLKTSENNTDYKTLVKNVFQNSYESKDTYFKTSSSVNKDIILEKAAKGNYAAILIFRDEMDINYI